MDTGLVAHSHGVAMTALGAMITGGVDRGSQTGSESEVNGDFGSDARSLNGPVTMRFSYLDTTTMLPRWDPRGFQTVCRITCFRLGLQSLELRAPFRSSASLTQWGLKNNAVTDSVTASRAWL